MKYDDENCYWCGKHIGEGKLAYFSLGTDTMKTTRNFCSEDHIQQFRMYKNQQIERHMPVIPYVGRKPHEEIGREVNNENNR
jgi:hypothetical protein